MIPASLRRILEAQKPKLIEKQEEYTVVWRDGEILRVGKDGRVKWVQQIQPL